MKSDFLFDPKDLRHKRPFGALSAEQATVFSVKIGRVAGVTAVSLVLREDGGPPRRIAMSWADLDEGHDVYRCETGPFPAGLYWYWFEAESAGKTAAFGAEAPWQLTVYDAAYATPGWFDGGVVYHIFIDRFFHAGPPRGRRGRPFRLHVDWYEAPDLYPTDEVYQNHDFFGGNLRGVEEKLDYIESLGVTAIYLSPIFEAFSNHRYDTGDFLKIDPLLGDEADFRRLCAEAGRRGMRVVLDGVFNHTGSDSRYFNGPGRYDSVGAAQSPESPYFGWYQFRRWPDDYACWWGVKSLPAVDKADGGYIAYTLTGEDSVVKHWLAAGASGFRLDVVDELPQAYVETLRAAVKAAKPDAVVLGEVWEDATNKVSYGARRHYLLGKELDGVTNYPAREAILGFVRGGGTAGELARALRTLQENYPPPARRCLMNLLGTHDTVRALNALGCSPKLLSRSREEKAAYALTADERELGRRRLILAAALQYMLPGAPCLYYGDEAGLEGFEDPLNRRGYPWGREDAALLAWYRALGRMRREYRVVFAADRLELTPVGDGAITVTRGGGGWAVRAHVNRGAEPVAVPMKEGAQALAGPFAAGGGRLTVPPQSAVIILEPEDDHD